MHAGHLRGVYNVLCRREWERQALERQMSSSSRKSLEPLACFRVWTSMWKEMHVEEAILVWIHFINKMETAVPGKRGLYATLGAEAHRIRLNETGSR